MTLGATTSETPGVLFSFYNLSHFSEQFQPRIFKNTTYNQALYSFVFMSFRLSVLYYCQHSDLDLEPNIDSYQHPFLQHVV